MRITAWQCVSPEVTVKGFKSDVYPMHWMRLIVVCCEMAVRRMGMLGVSVEDEGTVGMETGTLIGKGT